MKSEDYVSFFAKKADHKCELKFKATKYGTEFSSIYTHYIFGATFLKKYTTIFDFDKATISIAPAVTLKAKPI